MRATALTLLTGLLLASAAVVVAQKPVTRVPLDQVKWKPADPANFGFQEAVVEGDPAKPGIYVIYVKFPPGVMSKPHYHGEDRYGTVLKGTWYTGEGEAFEPTKTVGLKVGSFMKHPSNTRHYDGALGEEVIVQLIGIGPTSTTRVKPNEGLFGPSNPGARARGN
jgi:quercetin dioxygenase-like cupin family protein